MGEDPRIGLVTVLDVEPTEDLKEAKIYVSVLGTQADASKTKHALDDAAGYIQREVGRNLETRNTPTLRFVFDEPDERDLRPLGFPMKHRFAREQAADLQAVEPTHEFAVEESLDRVRPAKAMEFSVGVVELARDPMS